MPSTLTVTSPGDDRSFAVTGTLSIGRSSENDIVLSHSDVSRRHATLAEVASGVVFVDLGSTNGSFLNGQRVPPNAQMLLRPGDMITIADATLALLDEESARSAGTTIRAHPAEPRPADAAPAGVPPPLLAEVPVPPALPAPPAPAEIAAAPAFAALPPPADVPLAPPPPDVPVAPPPVADVPPPPPRAAPEAQWFEPPAAAAPPPPAPASEPPATRPEPVYERAPLASPPARTVFDLEPAAPPASSTVGDPPLVPPTAPPPPAVPAADPTRAVRGGPRPVFGGGGRPRASSAPPEAARPIPVPAAAPAPAPLAGRSPAAAPAPGYDAIPWPVGGPRPQPGNRGVAALLCAGVVITFFVFLMTHMIDHELFDSGYYKGVLAHSNAYDRAYSDIAADPSLSGEVNDLTGGFGLPKELVGAVQTVVPSTLLQQAVEAAIDHIISYLKHHSSLDLSLDVTGITGGLGGGVVSLVTNELLGLPTKDEPNYDQFKADMQAALDGIKKNGKLPAAIPDFEIPANRRPEIVAMIVQAAGLNESNPNDAKTVRAIRSDVADDDMEAALKDGMGPLIHDTTSSSQSQLLGGSFIQQKTVNGEEHQLLGPPPDVTKRVSDAMFWIHLVSGVSVWLRPLSLVLGLALLGVLAWLMRGDRVDMYGWPGAALLVAGALGFFGWLIGREVTKTSIVNAALGDNSDLPVSYQKLVKDVIAQALTDLTPTIWIPCVIAAVAGAILLAVAFIAARRLHAAVEAPAV